MSVPAIAGLILSGGESRRMGFPKALLELDGQTFLDRLIDSFAGICDPLVVALGYEADRIESGILRGRAVQFARNPDPKRGMLTSLQCGLQILPGDASAVIFTPVDFPQLRRSTILALAAAFRTSSSPVTVPVHSGQHGHPVCISRDVVREILDLPASAQARDVIRSHRLRTCFVEVPDPGILTDIDLPEEYRELRHSRAGAAAE